MVDEVLGLCTDVVPLGRGVVVLGCPDAGKNLVVVVSVEGRVAAKEDVSNDANAPHVTTLVILLVQNLWSHVVGGPHLGLHHVGRAGVLVPTQTKVDNLDLAMLVRCLEQEILGFKIPMANVLNVVAVGNGLDDLLDDLGGVVLRKMPLLALRFGNDPVEELPSSAKLRHEVEVFLVLINLVKVNDIGVGDLLEDLDLPL
mmetsp:Transcript_969/g.1691  ORF Transcript_969/g.1691 Transcript_969/m.1691 type:complete len:200 (-) Transcript_969:320-919(-)